MCMLKLLKEANRQVVCVHINHNTRENNDKESAFIKESTVAMSILDKTPLIGAMVSDTYDAIVEISDLQEKYQDSASKDEYNAEILGIMLRYNVVTPDTARKLIDNGKLDFAGAETVLNTFEEE